VSLLIYNESWLDINDLDSMKEIAIIVYIHALYQTLLSDIQSIFVSLIFKYIEKLFEFNESWNSDRICREVNDKKRLIVQDLCNDLRYHCKKLRIQLYINWRTENNEWRWNDNIMLLNLILKLCIARKISSEFSITLWVNCLTAHSSLIKRL